VRKMAKKRGMGMASIFYGIGYGNGFADASSAFVEIHEDGTATVRVGAAECGQGVTTILAQIAAEEIGIRVDDVTVITEDTDATPDAGTSAATRQTYTSGNAVRIAAREARDLLYDRARVELGVNTLDGIVGEDGFVYPKGLPQKKISIKELAFRAKSEGFRMLGNATFTSHSTKVDLETGQGAPYWPYTFAVQIVEVEVDTLTGIVEVIKVYAANDVGKAINPISVKGQMEGGICQGLGMALFEEVELNEGKIKNPNLSKYLIPTFADMPEIETLIVESPEPTGPYGAKGVGEPCLIPTAPAIINAIYDAVGVRITSLPATPEKILKALKEKNTT
jgi:CO/xanthine dehydrogenase Mo-binding subunit